MKNPGNKALKKYLHNAKKIIVAILLQKEFL